MDEVELVNTPLPPPPPPVGAPLPPPAPPASPKHPWYRRRRNQVIAGIAAVVVIAAGASGGKDDEDEGVATAGTTVAVSDQDVPAPTTAAPTTAAPPTTNAAPTTEAPVTTPAPTTTDAPMTTDAPTPTLGATMEFQAWVAAHVGAITAWNAEVVAAMGEAGNAANELDVAGVLTGCRSLQRALRNAPEWDSPNEAFNALLTRATTLFREASEACLEGDFETAGSKPTAGGSAMEEVTALVASNR